MGGCNRNDSGNFISPMILVLFLGFIVFGIFMLDKEDCSLSYIESTDKNEIVKSINYNHSFMDGNYCIVVTDKDAYTLYHTETCIKNKVGKYLVTGDWENICEGVK